MTYFSCPFAILKKNIFGNLINFLIIFRWKSDRIFNRCFPLRFQLMVYKATNSKTELKLISLLVLVISLPSERLIRTKKLVQTFNWQTSNNSLPRKLMSRSSHLYFLRPLYPYRGQWETWYHEKQHAYADLRYTLYGCSLRCI